MSQTQFTQPLIQQSSPLGSLGFGGTMTPAISLLREESLGSRREEPEDPKTMRAFARVSAFVAEREEAGEGVGGEVAGIGGVEEVGVCG
jgi:hypothetical protein